jgi:2'-5' RNA ligase
MFSTFRFVMRPMARYPFLVEIRPDQEVKNYLREIINDVQSRFNVHAMANGHVVPHLSLFGPFTADGYGPVLSAIRSACEQFSVVPYRLDGFCHFRRDVIYVDIATSPALRSLRRELRDNLLPSSIPRYPRREKRQHYQYHMTVAFKDIGGKFADIWDFVTDRYEPQIETYAHRVTFLNNRRMIKEWDLLTGEFLDADLATSKHSWEQTMDELNQKRSQSDHDKLAKPHRGGLREWRRRLNRVISRF